MCESVTLAVQLVWVILPEVEMVCVKIFPSSGIQGPQMLSDVWKLVYLMFRGLMFVGHSVE